MLLFIKKISLPATAYSAVPYTTAIHGKIDKLVTIIRFLMKWQNYSRNWHDLSYIEDLFDSSHCKSLLQWVLPNYFQSSTLWQFSITSKIALSLTALNVLWQFNQKISISLSPAGPAFTGAYQGTIELTNVFCTSLN